MNIFVETQSHGIISLFINLPRLGDKESVMPIKVKPLQWSASLLSNFTIIQLARQDFSVFYAPFWVLIGFLVIPILMYLGINADLYVLNGILGSVSGDPESIWWKAMVFAVSISIVLCFTGYMIVSIKQNRLHKDRCLDKDGKEIVNSRKKHHRSQLRTFQVLHYFCLIITLGLSFMTKEPVKMDAEDKKIDIVANQSSTELVTSEAREKERQAIISQYDKDLLVLENEYGALYKAKAGRNGVRLESANNELATLKEELRSKSTASDRKSQIRIRIAELQRVNIPRYEGHVVSQTRRVVSKKADAIQTLQLKKDQSLALIDSKYILRDSISQSLYVANHQDLAASVITSSRSTMGYNIFINLLLTFCVRGFAKYSGGATHGKELLVFEQEQAHQSGVATPESATQRNHKKPQRKKPQQKGKVVATSISADMNLEDLRAAKAKYKSNLRAHQSNKRNDKGSNATDDHIKKWSDKVADVQAKIDAKKNEPRQSSLSVA